MSFDGRLLDQRVAESLDCLRTHCDAVENSLHEPRVMQAVRGLRDTALGGKHLRARLVHIAAGDVAGEQHDTAVVFGAAIDMLHAAFLIHDDVIDEDPLRRGEVTIHERVRRETGSRRVGDGVGILTGDLGLVATFQFLSQQGISLEHSQKAMQLMTRCAAETVAGEILDVQHLVEEDVDIDSVRASNLLKTTLYSFTAPLHLGAIAANRDDEDTLELFSQVASCLGHAYQAADDIAGVLGDTARTGKVSGGDVQAGRRTLLTLRLEQMSLENAVREVVAEGEEHIAQARTLLADAPLAPFTRAGLSDTTAQLETQLHAYV